MLDRATNRTARAFFPAAVFLSRAVMLAAMLRLPCSPLHAQEQEAPAISTERPTVGDSPDLIPAGSLQVESGAAVEFAPGGYVTDLPESLLRLGITDRVEARFLTSDAVITSSHGSSDTEPADTAVSAKLLISGPDRPLPKSAVLTLSLPTGGRPISSGSYDPGLVLIWTQAFPRNCFLNEVAAATLTTLNGARRPEWAPSLAFGGALLAALTAFVEYAPTVLDDGSVSHVVDGGFLITQGKLQQFDIRTGYIHDAQGSHGLFGIGYSFRRDKLLPAYAHTAATLSSTRGASR